MWLSVLLHTVAVAVALGVALVLVKILGVDSPVVMTVIGLVVVALEKLIRESPSIPVDDYVNRSGE